MRRHRTIARLAVLALAPFVLVAPSGAREAAEPTCQGQEATVPLVAGRYRGTPFADVIIVTEQAGVDGEAGDDLVCVDDADGSFVYGHEGNDTVLIRDASYSRFKVNLGKGDDTFTGGVGDDKVFTNGHLAGHDVVATGGGDDFVYASSDNADEPGEVPTLALDLGGGDDDLYLFEDGFTADSTLEGGAGRDQILFRSAQVGSLVVDARAHTIERDEPVVSHWSSFEVYAISDHRAEISFAGSRRPETLLVLARRIHVDLGAGDDVLKLPSFLRGDAQGGPGRDQVVVGERQRVDLVATVVRRRGRPSPRRVTRIHSFQDVMSLGGGVRGDERDNRITVGCDEVIAGGGDDVVRAVGEYAGLDKPMSCRDFVAFGGGGDDVLVGSRGPDRLIGGPGSDTAYGSLGRDACLSVESQHRC